jgi:hypothetical protein
MSRRQTRASDAERERIALQLRDAAAEGRMSTDELEERVAAAFDAVSHQELDALVRDLDTTRPPVLARASMPWFPGRWAFSEHFPAPRDIAAVHASVLKSLVPIFTRYGYELVERSDDRFVLRRRQSSWPLFVFLGLLAALIPRDTDTVTIDMVATERSTTIVVQGYAPLGLRRAFARLKAELA